uniref:Chitin-binding type-2 domain-containing protein n=1 Tax=Biomphalaria glabrata TaxID=6526 RepID=A0A2C9LRT5_BIOGL
MPGPAIMSVEYVAIILLVAASALAKIGPEAVISCAKGSGQGRMYPDPDDCRKFIRCVSRKPVSFTCPPNTAFDPDTQVCAWRVGKNGCGGKLAPTTWVGMIDNLINDITQKNEVTEKISNGYAWEKPSKRFDQDNAPKHFQKYMSLEKSSRDLVDESQQTMSTHTVTKPTKQPLKVKSSQLKRDYVPPQKSKMASTELGDKVKNKYRSYSWEKAKNVFNNGLGSSQTNSQLNSTKAASVKEEFTTESSIKANGNPNKFSGLSLRSMSPSAVGTMPLSKEVKAEAYKITVGETFKRDNGTSNLNLNVTSNLNLNVTSNSSLATETPSKSSQADALTKSKSFQQSSQLLCCCHTSLGIKIYILIIPQTSKLVKY